MFADQLDIQLPQLCGPSILRAPHLRMSPAANGRAHLAIQLGEWYAPAEGASARRTV